MLLSLLLLVLFTLGQVNGQTATDAKNLRTQLFVTDAYDRRVRPIDNQSQPIGMVTLQLFVKPHWVYPTTS